jgi:glycerol-3-phosphate dehydrogenase
MSPSELLERSSPFDIIVIGGGILGACVARDAALRGLSVAVVEKGDFGGGTSWNSLKIVHGGLRYLQHLDVVRMRESIRERSHWLRIAPHLIEPLPIVVPTRSRGLQRRSLLRAALLANDLISWDRNRALEPSRRLPAGRNLARDECLRLVPELDGATLTGGVMFYDAQMYSAERLVLGVLKGAIEAGAVAANYVAFEDRLLVGERLAGVKVRDAISGERFDVRARIIVNAAGPAAPRVAGRLTGHPSAAATRYSAALNLMVRGHGHAVAFALAGTRSDPSAVVRMGKRQLFFVPWRDRTLIGTGHYPYEGDPVDARLDEYLQVFLQEVNSAWPGANYSPDDLLLVHSGQLPVDSTAKSGEVNLMKRHRVIDHEVHGVPEAVSAISVKFTTSRLVAEEVVNLVCDKLGHTAPRCETSEKPLPGAPEGRFEDLLSSVKIRHRDLLPEDVLEHLARAYGTEYVHVLDYRKTMWDWDERVHPSAPVIKAQFAHAVRSELARRPEDIVWRRTELGPLGLASERALSVAAGQMEGDR